MPRYRIETANGTYDVDAADDAQLETVISELNGGSAQSAPATPKRKYDIGADLKRQLGLTARAAVTGLTGLPTMIGDAASVLMNNTPAQILGRMKGRPTVEYGMPSEAVQAGLTAAGLPQPQGPLERAVNVGGSALAGAGGAKALADGARAAPAGLQSLLQMLGDSPRLQAIGATTGALGVEGAKQAGVDNPAALLAIGAVSSVLPGGAQSVAGRLGSGVKQAAAPFTARGKEVLVGEALNRVATNPAAAAERLANPEILVPGSRPMVQEVSRDPGMIGAYSALRGMDEQGRIPQRLSEQNSARQAEMARIAGNDGTLSQATAKRDRAYQEIAVPAFENATPIKVGREWINNPVLRTIREIRESPAGARQTVREALDEAERMVTQEGADLSDARVLYEIRKDLDLLRKGELSGAGLGGRERANMRTANSELSRVISSLDQTIESGAPGYQSYMRMFAKRSVPLEQLKGLQSLREKAVLAAPDPVTGEEVLSQAKFRTLLRNNIGANADYNRAPLNGRGPGQNQLRISVPGTREPVLANLSSQQMRTLDRIAQDLDRGAAATAGTMKVPGSDTFKNMSIAAVIGRVLGDKTGELVMNSSAGKAVAAPFSFLYRMPDRDVQLLMLEAWLDPRLASRLMRQASRAEIESVASELGRRAAQQSAASALYSAE